MVSLAIMLASSLGVTNGACCVDFQCYPSEQAACLAVPGAYFAADLTCAEAFCPLPALGACCLPPGCEMTTQHDCVVNRGGIYRGNNTECHICVSDCYSDVAPPITPDHVVNVDDLLVVINQWGDGDGHGAWEFAGDIAPLPNGDGVVNVNDLLAVINAWDPCP